MAFSDSGLLTWFRSTGGTGGFSAGIDIATNLDNIMWVTLADIDGDDDLDVVAASGAGGK